MTLNRAHSFLQAFYRQMQIKQYEYVGNKVIHFGMASTRVTTSIVDEDTHKVHHLMVKMANCDAFRPTQSVPIREAFINETHFYANVYQALKPYLNDDVAPRLLVYSREEFEEGLMLDDLEKHGYQSLGKGERLREDALKLLMKAYGKLHGSSFVLKDKDEGRYTRLGFGYTNISPLMYLGQWPPHVVSFEDTLQHCLEFLDEASDVHIREKFMKYVANPASTLMVFWTKFENCNCFLHGNARSSNFLFKLDEKKKPSSVRLVDFAHSKIGSPILDLSYCIYANSSKSEFEKLDEYLSIYHDALSETLEEFGCNPKLIFPYNLLKEQWEFYGKFGLLMALRLMREQLMEKSFVTEVDYETLTVKCVPEVCQETYKRRFKDLVYHMDDIGAL